MTKLFIKMFAGILILLCPLTIIAQQPDWVNSNFRSMLYPKEQFLTGFTFQTNVSRVDNSLIEKAIGDSKTRLVESIFVNVQSQSIHHVMETGDAFTESFDNFIKSSSEADLVGLNVETYFDQENTTLYAFSYADRQEMIDFYKYRISGSTKDITNSIERGELQLKTGSLEKVAIDYRKAALALDLYQADHEILVYLSGRDDGVLGSEDAKVQFNNRLDNLKSNVLEHARCNATVLGHLMIVDIIPTLAPNVCELLTISNFEFENSGLTGPLSEDILSSLKSGILEFAPNIKLIETKTPDQYEGCILMGQYALNGNSVPVLVKLLTPKGNELVYEQYTLNGKNLVSAGESFLPPLVEKFETLKNVKLTIPNRSVSLTTGSFKATPLKANLTRVIEGNLFPNSLAGFPISYKLANTNKTLCKTTSNRYGQTDCTPDAIDLPPSQIPYTVTVSIDVPKFLAGIDTMSAYYRQNAMSSTPNKASLIVKVRGLQVYIEQPNRQSGNFGYNRISAAFNNLGFKATTNLDEADLYLSYQCTPVNNKYSAGMHFSYVDLNATLRDLRTGKDIYNKLIPNIKGSDRTRQGATNKATEAALEKLTEELKGGLVKML